jgi:hypothetical protein
MSRPLMLVLLTLLTLLAAAGQMAMSGDRIQADGPVGR